ncbi:NUDIX hydrolase [Phenylobacterium montanum]|uniref:NAD regulator n=1 Tax=Phenylobacterium montanum TaxID=2823693 RepID=A0A975G088_9CAUL|nr:NAD regulator [Caulobacter sp. S6]QUD88092.1 NAD regulator [Caulobacter sp. S6]
MTAIVIGLSAVVVAIRRNEAVVLTVRPHDSRTRETSALAGLPFGPFDPDGHRTFELALRAFVTEQTRFELGYVEQLYTFGDKGRDAPRAEVGAGGARVISVGYLALTPQSDQALGPDTVWAPMSRFFPWEDWRAGRPELIDEAIAPALRRWAVDEQRLARARLLFALDGAPWNEERVLERYELLYEAGLAPEAARDRERERGGPGAEPAEFAASLGQPMLSDHRRILATGLGRLRGKLKYRPVAFELTPPEFTLSQLQRTVEAIAGVALHKQNFRRVLERADLVEGLGRQHTETGGRPAELFRFRRELARAGRAPGLALPLLREG